MHRILVTALLVAGCKGPTPPAPPATLTAPSISGAFVAALDPPIPAAARPTSVFVAYPSSIEVGACIDLDGVNWLCWAARPSYVTVGPACGGQSCGE